jgi:hypothetical protein
MTSHDPGVVSIASLIARLKNADSQQRESAAAEIFQQGRAVAQGAIAPWLKDVQLRDCLRLTDAGLPEMVVGIAVDPESFEDILAAVGMPRLAEVPPDQDAKEFELDFSQGVRLDVLTTRELGGPGAIARYLQKFGAGINRSKLCRAI